jgi:phosphatidylethanolamine/phosphatidyl-N-methylethanolamine N-methyltransferase
MLGPAPDAAAARQRLTKRTGDRQIFFRHWLKNPLGIGAAWPSGSRVARGMSREIALDAPGAVLELGGGTGSLTRGLLAAGCPEDRLVVIEREPDLARFLQQELPRVKVLCGDACDAGKLLDAAGVTQLTTVVSSLPIKWFPRPAQRAVLDACFARLRPGGAFIQLTNALASPIPAGELGLVGREVERIWAHFLPVQIWRYQRPGEAESGRC